MTLCLSLGTQIDPLPFTPNTKGLPESNHRSLSYQLKQLQENLNVLTLDVACFVGGSYYFCVQILLKKKKE